MRAETEYLCGMNPRGYGTVGMGGGVTVRRGLLGIIALMVGFTAGSAGAGTWQLGEITTIEQWGTRPNVWKDTVAYQIGACGCIKYFDGYETVEVFSPPYRAYEPVNANVAVAFRNKESSSGSYEIMRWDGESLENVSQTPGVLDSDLSGAGNGDLLWSEDQTWLRYYDASENTTVDLGVRGNRAALYVTDAGLATYAYQDPDTYEVYYFDGFATHDLGPGPSDGAQVSLWDGAVAFVRGEGGDPSSREIFFWKAGTLWQLTDDGDDGVIDQSPAVYNDVVVWSRAAQGPFRPWLMLWDGEQVVTLLDTGCAEPSFHGGVVAWQDSDAVYVADVFVPGDLDEDGDADLDDYEIMANCMTGPLEIGAGDLDDDYDVDLDDFTLWQECMVGPGLPVETGCSEKDLDGDEDVDLADYARFVQLLNRAAGYVLPEECEVADLDGDADVDFADFSAFSLVFGP